MDRVCVCGSLFINVYSLWQSQKLSFFIFLGQTELNKRLISEDHSKPIILVNQIFFQVILTKVECLFVLLLEIKFLCSLYLAGWVTVPTYFRAVIFEKR